MGESMGVVTDILMEELRAEYDQVRNTWIPPEVHAVTLQDLEAATAALKNLEVSRAASERREKSICLRQVCSVWFDPSPKTTALSWMAIT